MILKPETGLSLPARDERGESRREGIVAATSPQRAGFEKWALPLLHPPQYCYGGRAGPLLRCAEAREKRFVPPTFNHTRSSCACAVRLAFLKAEAKIPPWRSRCSR